MDFVVTMNDSFIIAPLIMVLPLCVGCTHATRKYTRIYTIL